MALQEDANTATTTNLLALPPENIALLLNFCDRQSLENLALTCRGLHGNIALALKYREIDISAHNRGRFPYTHWNGRVTYYWSDQYPPRFDVEDLARKQHQFLNEVLDRPYVGKLVHDFTWTIRSYCDPDGYWPGRMTQDAVYPDTHMWKAFQNLSNVTKLDLSCYQETWDWKYLRQPPKSLFPAVTELRLSGIMYGQIVETIFDSIEAARLEHLLLDNLQDPGRSGNKYPYQRSVNGAANWNTAQTSQDTEEVKLPGTMRGILPILQGQCTSLRSFRYRKPGRWGNERGRSAWQDEQCYAELGSFIVSVSPTIEIFEFEQGVPESVMEALLASRNPNQRRCVGQITPDVMPMDARFVEYVLPQLSDSNWPKLRELKIIGVGRACGKPAIDAPMKARLKKHLGKDVLIQYQEVADRPCEEFNGQVV